MNHTKIPDSLKLAKFFALEILEQYNITKPPVDITKILNDLGLNLEEMEFPESVDNISGMLDIENKTIFINKNDADTRKAFTVAHELGHYVMHQQELAQNDSYAIVYRKENKNRDIIERQADQFAAHLLAPKFLLDNFVADFSAPQLAKLFGVSPQMMEFRLTNEYQ
ncbi:MAG: ImmA/IrrE family metallo-endopeptidase [Candidatus Gracilibacteria bacterium]|nr:ImmA/IrrE family metallo-endopeptidase [Candidatus Gracilibacteria bacterium]